jgi:hypothetical protein
LQELNDFGIYARLIYVSIIEDVAIKKQAL